MIKQSRDRATGGRRITFVLPADRPSGRVSVVGTFNDWTPGTHELRKRSNGTRSASVTVPAGASIRFRYLGEHGAWFDEPDADAVTHEGSLLHG